MSGLGQPRLGTGKFRLPQLDHRFRGADLSFGKIELALDLLQLALRDDVGGGELDRPVMAGTRQNLCGAGAGEFHLGDRNTGAGRVDGRHQFSPCPGVEKRRVERMDRCNAFASVNRIANRILDPVKMAGNRGGDGIDIANAGDPVLGDNDLQWAGFDRGNVDKDRLFAEGDVERAADRYGDRQSCETFGKHRGHGFNPLFSRHG